MQGVFCLELSDFATAAPIAISVVAVCVSLYSVHQSRKAILNGTYFSEMAQAYADFLKCVADFAHQRGMQERDALCASLYRVELFAPRDISVDAQNLYIFLLDWAASNPTRALSVDEKVNNLGLKMRNHLGQFRQSGGTI